MDEVLVFCDLETAGLDFARHPVIQMAVIAIDAELNELEAFERKIQFDEADADPKSLKKNNYSKRLWHRAGRPPVEAAHEFSRFLRRHATVDMLSANGKPYRVAQLVAHNAERFDAPFLHAWYERLGVYLPARYMPLCTKQRALWLCDEDKTLTGPSSVVRQLSHVFCIGAPVSWAAQRKRHFRLAMEVVPATLSSSLLPSFSHAPHGPIQFDRSPDVMKGVVSILTRKFHAKILTERA